MTASGLLANVPDGPAFGVKADIGQPQPTAICEPHASASTSALRTAHHMPLNGLVRQFYFPYQSLRIDIPITALTFICTKYSVEPYASCATMRNSSGVLNTAKNS